MPFIQTLTTAGRRFGFGIVASLALVGAAEAVTVTFAGNVTGTESSGSIDSITGQFDAGDMFRGSFTLDTSTTGTDVSGGLAGLEFNVFDGAVTAFELEFISGVNNGLQLIGVAPTISSVSVSNDDRPGSTGNDSLGLVTPINYAGAGLTDLNTRNVVLRIFDPSFQLVDSGNLGAVDWNNLLSIPGIIQSSEIAFNQATTGFSQRANITLSSLQVAAVPLPASLPLLLGGMLLLGGLARRKRA